MVGLGVPGGHHQPKKKWIPKKSVSMQEVLSAVVGEVLRKYFSRNANLRKLHQNLREVIRKIEAKIGRII